jgi:hypothetical protein
MFDNGSADATIVPLINFNLGKIISDLTGIYPTYLRVRLQLLF